MDKQEKLVSLLRRLDRAEDPNAVRAEARDFLRQVSPAELSLAEQQLLGEGLETKDLRQLCELHMEVLEDELQKARKEDLPAGHLLHTLMSEHEMILDFVDELEGVNRSIQGMDAYEPGREEFRKLAHIAEHLVEAELHHQREEDVLFPEMENRGVSGPPEVMRLEHTLLRERKHQLKELAEGAGEMDFARFKSSLGSAVEFIVDTLPDHILKEDNILYPAARELIEEDRLWEELKARCDEIGYCCFSPEA